METSKTKTEKIWKEIDAQKVETDLANGGITWNLLPSEVHTEEVGGKEYVVH